MSIGASGADASADWEFAGESSALSPGVVMLVEGSSFCVSGRSGDIDSGSPQGLFFRDTRIVSESHLRVDGAPVEPLAVISHDPYRCTFVARARPRPGTSDTTILVVRERLVGIGMREDLRVRNLGGRPVECQVTVAVNADFADLFEVKESRVRLRDGRSTQVTPQGLLVQVGHGGSRRGVRIEAAGAVLDEHGMRWQLSLAPHSDWVGTILVHPYIDGEELAGSYPLDRPLDQSPPARRLLAWRAGSPRVITANHALQVTLQRSLEDLGALRIFDPKRPDLAAVAAGAPWFMALFGRDSLLSSYMALPLDQTLALGTLQTLARRQGTVLNRVTEEEPGRILHETRLGVHTGLALGNGEVYYGTADATPLFVVLLGELARWGLARAEVEALLPHADRALDWIERYGDRDSDGFVEYQRATERGLANQGWKDSWDGINFADGRIAQAPIALCEVQGYVYSAYVARAHFAFEHGDSAAANRWTDKAQRLRTAFNERFWLPDRGWFAVGLDRDKAPIDALASNMGHALWSGIVDAEKAPVVAERLLSTEMFTGWGVRTLATSMAAYNPMSYHNGSVWPHDNALIVAGLMRYGFVDAAQRVATAVLDAARTFGGRLPELFCGFDRREYPSPVPYPTSCSPQAWAAATPVQLLRSLLRIDPFMSRRQLWLDPAWPDRFGPLTVENLGLDGSRLAISVDGDDVSVTGLPTDIALVREPRPSLTAAFDQ